MACCTVLPSLCCGRGLGALLALALGAALALAQPLPEAELKAQILWRALQFVEWPAEVAPAQPLQLCLLAPGPLADTLRGWEGTALNGRRIELRRGAAPPPAVPITGCHIAYVGPEAVLPASLPRALLWVGDSHGLTERGVMLNLQPQQGRIVFDIELQAARRAGLEINARLLRLARFVRAEGMP
ncbi:YfiR family protein [Azohydromonas caseinilytica]|uniref:YfiR family protein n=1 Tax=Azohydromonas caseinilytica TaxID=2728836 RepID=A0A848F5Y2_9BURK|nr:YfiR family protein [Azohydromonas caseinilytica]NML13773.1 YfiR family protein [Azohydromonas caseinilytica]